MLQVSFGELWSGKLESMEAGNHGPSLQTWSSSKDGFPERNRRCKWATIAFTPLSVHLGTDVCEGHETVAPHKWQNDVRAERYHTPSPPCAWEKYMRFPTASLAGKRQISMSIRIAHVRREPSGRDKSKPLPFCHKTKFELSADRTCSSSERHVVSFDTVDSAQLAW